MYFDSVADLFYMASHGISHGAYVWSAYGISFASLLLLIIYPIRRKQKLLAAIKQRQLFEQEES